MIEAGACPDGFGRDPEMVPERAGECFVRAVIRIQRERENIGRAGCERARGFREATGAHVTHHRKAGRRSKGAHHVETRHTGDARNLVEGQSRRKMAFDVPERLLRGIHGGIHKATLSYETKAAYASFAGVI